MYSSTSTWGESLFLHQPVAYLNLEVPEELPVEQNAEDSVVETVQCCEILPYSQLVEATLSPLPSSVSFST